jgi:GTP pyrophosphokinase
MSDIDRAIEIAVQAHRGDTDKAGEAYIRHPLRVMEQMDTENERIAAVLHDVVEDSDYTLTDIENEFGSEIRAAVDALTRRKEADEDYLAEFIPRAKDNEIARSVKQADIQDNMDLTRLPEVTDDTLARLEKYHQALQQLS